MKLEEYWEKRDFEKTEEPKGEEKMTGGNIYVIQKHQATHLHYDLRLEMNGVLKSWAIPTLGSPTHKCCGRIVMPHWLWRRTARRVFNWGPGSLSVAPAQLL